MTRRQDSYHPMHHLYITAALLMFLSAFPVPAQDDGRDFSVILGEEDILPASSHLPRIMGCDSGAIYALGRDYLYYMKRYSPQLECEIREEIKLYEKLREREIIAVVHFFDTLYLFTMEERFKYNYLYVETIDKESMKQNFDARIVFRARHIKGWETEFGVVLSREEKRLLAYSQNILPWRSMQYLQFKVFGNGLDLQWEKRTHVSYEHIFNHETQMVVDEAGNVFMLDHYFEPTLPRPLDPRVNGYLFLSLTENGSIRYEDVISFTGKYIKDIRINTYRNRDMACTGLWSERRFEGQAEGVFYFRFNTRNGRLEDPRFHTFPDGIIASFLDAKPEKEPEEMLGIQLLEFIPRNSGQYIAIAEQQFEQDYHAVNNLLIYAIRPTGDIAWYEVIRKKQNRNTLNRWDYNSFALVAPVDKDWVGILYNDDLRNLDTKRKRLISFNHNSRGYFNCVQINKNGNRKEFAVYRKSKRRMPTPLPTRFYDTKTNAIILPANRYRRYFLMWIRLEDFIKP